MCIWLCFNMFNAPHSSGSQFGCISNQLKVLFTWKWNICHNLLKLMSLPNWMTFFLFCKTEYFFPPNNESLWSPKQLPAFFKIIYSMFSRRNKVIKVWKLHTRAIDYRISLFGNIYLIHLILNYKFIVLHVMSGVTAKTFFFNFS